MEAITPMAQSISTYGLYAIVAILSVVVVYLFKQQMALEKELRTTVKQNADETTKLLTQNASEQAKLLSQTTDALKANTQAFQEFQNTLQDLKMTIQLLMERKRP